MLHSTKGIVLSRFKYNDTSIITQIYTEKFGKQSYIIFTGKSRKNRTKISLLHPLYLLDMQVYNKSSSNIQKVKEISIDKILNSFSGSIKKNSIALFIAEILNKSLKDNEPDKMVYDYLSNSIQILDLSEKKYANFHLIFLFHLTKYIGFFPADNYSETKKIFDLREGKFTLGIPAHNDFLNEKLSFIFQSLFKISTNEHCNFKINSTNRNQLLNAFIKYYEIHIGFHERLKSFEILKEVFGG